MSSISDIWEISDDDETKDVFYDKKIASREWERMNEAFGNLGYKDGILEGKETTLQRGFDIGYMEGMIIGKELGRIRGVCNTILEFYTSKKKLATETDTTQSPSMLNPDSQLLVRLRSLERDLAKITYDDLFTKQHFEQTKSLGIVDHEDEKDLKPDLEFRNHMQSFHGDEDNNTHQLEEKKKSSCSRYDADIGSIRPRDSDHLFPIKNNDFNSSAIGPIGEHPLKILVAVYRDKMFSLLKEFDLDIPIFLG
ncbi:hypothetical protein G9A89_002862 [Geosiphon pyriformis]|nr:hypothetical protein G9A89_002862 [Geosiphon pyriformis]